MTEEETRARLLKTYRKTELVKAVRITEHNREELLKIDGDGCVEIADLGDWLVEENCGFQIYNNTGFKMIFEKCD